MKPIVLLGCCLFLGCAPSHLHNPGREEDAIKAQEAMGQYAMGAPGMYNSMLENLDAFRVEEERVLAELLGTASDSVVTLVPTADPSTIKDRLKNRSAELVAFDGWLVNQANSFLTEEGDAKNEFKESKEAVVAAKEKVQRARQNVDRWNKTVALLEAAFSELNEDLTKDRETGLTTTELKEQLKDIADTQIKYVDSFGKEKKSTVSDIVTSALLEKADSRAAGVLCEAPGIDLTILNLGLELAEIDQLRARQALDSLKARSDAIQEAYVSMKVAGQFLEEIKAFIDKGEYTESAYEHLVTFHKTLQDEWDKPGGEPQKMQGQQQGAFLLLLALRKLVLVEVTMLRARQRLKLQLARLDHRDSIVRSKTNDGAWQALIRAGLSGLVAYHKTGWTKEDTANVVALVQTVAQTSAVGILANQVR